MQREAVRCPAVTESSFLPAYLSLHGTNPSDFCSGKIRNYSPYSHTHTTAFLVACYKHQYLRNIFSKVTTFNNWK